MPERLEKLREAIDELERELNSVESLDDPAREKLADAVEDIQSALREEDTSHLEERGVRARLDQSLQDFEASHPSLASLLSRIVDMLGQIGI